MISIFNKLFFICFALFFSTPIYAKMIIVKNLIFPTVKPSIELIEKMLDSLSIPFHSIETVNWATYPYAPEVRFRIAYNKDELFLQFIVKEDAVRVTYSNDETSKPYEDSCVEFFWIPADDGIYYNLEFNAIGTLLFQGGAQRGNRYRFPNEVTTQIRRASTLGSETFGLKEGVSNWQLTIAIPLSLFSLSKVAPLEGRTVRANFYKCGDKLPVPHFLSWNPVETERPNFHAPHFFGTLLFEP